MQTFEEYLAANIQNFLHKRDSLLTTALRCQMVHLQSVCITEILLEIIERARKIVEDRYGYSHSSLRSVLPPEFEKLFSYDLHPTVKKRLDKAVIEIICCGMASGCESGLKGLDRKVIEDIMI